MDFRATQITTIFKIPTVLLEASDSRAFVGIHVEYCEQLCDLQKVVHFLGQMQQFQFALPIADCGEPAHQFADPGAIDIRHIAKV